MAKKATLKKRPRSRAKPQRKTAQLPRNIPHISRNYYRIGIAAILLILIGFSEFYAQKYDKKDDTLPQLMRGIIANTDRAGEYRKVGHYFEGKLDFTNAKYFYTLAKEHGGGEADKDLVRIAAKERLPWDMRTALTSWQQFTTDHPNYIDGWLQVAAYQWQLGQKNDAKHALEQVLLADPENQSAKQFLTAF